MSTIAFVIPLPIQSQVRTRADVFGDIFLVFLGLGTLVGLVVVAYTLYNAYKYRDDGQYARADDEDRPTLGELPTGGGGGRKLFVSFGLSAIIVVSLIAWTYTMLLYVEAGPGSNVAEQQEPDALEVQVVGWQFGWDFVYANGVETTGELRVPEDTTIRIRTTSDDVWHTFGIPAMRVKSDAIPGEVDRTWFRADEPGNYSIQCFELCGAGHSNMKATLIVMEEDEFQQWYENAAEEAASENETAGNESTNETNSTQNFVGNAPLHVAEVTIDG